MIKCNLTKCNQHQIPNINITNNNKIYFYISLLNTIHCYFVHAIDIGFRIPTLSSNTIHKEYNINNLDVDNPKILKSNKIYKDKEMIKLKSELYHRRPAFTEIRGSKRRKYNKFITNISGSFVLLYIY